MYQASINARVDFPRLSYSLSEAEVLSGLSRATLYRLIAAGKLNTVQIGRRRLVPSDELAALVRPTGSAGCSDF